MAGPATASGYEERIRVALGRTHNWIRPFVQRLFRQFGSRLGHPQRQALVEFIRSDAGYVVAWDASIQPRIRRYSLASPAMAPRAGALAACALPALPTPGDLAEWLGVSVGRLDWYADRRGMNRVAEGNLCHYRYKWIPKRHGGHRLVESPKPGLCEIQRKILHEILDPVSVHGAAHGFRRDHSCLTYVGPHIGRQVVMRMDLRDFFGSIPAQRVNALFRKLGYPEATAAALTGLCTNRVSNAAINAHSHSSGAPRIAWLERRNLVAPHLPQGAPTSPALANLCALHLDFRLAGLAGSLDGNYTRYADDIALSGGESLRRSTGRIGNLVAAIALEEGFEVNHRKTRIMQSSDRQILTGIVINDRTNLRRAEYDRLKATLYNCVRFGIDSQNRDGHRDYRAHLRGRVNYVRQLNPSRGEKLERLLQQLEA